MGFVKDPVKPADRAEVYARDGGCIAPLVDPKAGPCRNRMGREIDRTDNRRGSRTLDHVPPSPGATRISTPRWMVQLCWGHHAHPSYWETAHRDEERSYLADKYGDLSKMTNLILRIKVDLGQSRAETTDQIAAATRRWLDGDIDRNPHLSTNEEVLLEGLAHAGVFADENAEIDISVDLTGEELAQA